MGYLSKRLSRAPTRGVTLRRPLAVPKFRQAAIERNLGRTFLSSLTDQRDKATPIKIDKVTMEAIEAEVSSLMYGGQVNRACKVTEIAMALRTSDVVDLYASAEEETTTNVEGISVKMGNLLRPLRFLERLSKNKDDELLRRKYAFMRAMDALESRPESIKTKVSTWEAARDALSAVLKFPDVNLDAASTKKLQDEAAKAHTDVFKARFSRFQKDVLDRRRPSSQCWKRVIQTPLPTKFADDDEVKISDESAIGQVDAARAKTLDAKYKELQERLKVKEVQEIEQRLKEKEAEDRASSLMRRLTTEEQAIVKEAIYGSGPPQQVIAQIGTDSVQRRSMNLLKPGEWLNDEVIHYFLVMLAKRDEELCRQDSNRKPTHFFKSFFLTKLLNEGDANPAKDGVYEYKNVKRWSKHVKGKDIFKLSKIFFPINQNQMHWFCAVAFMDEKRIQVYDSMGSDGRYFRESIFRYIQDEHKDKKGTPLPDIDKWKLEGCSRDTPRQKNGYDCGVFTCMFADFLSKDCPLLFNQQHITQCRERIALSIMKGSAIM